MCVWIFWKSHYKAFSTFLKRRQYKRCIIYICLFFFFSGKCIYHDKCIWWRQMHSSWSSHKYLCCYKCHECMPQLWFPMALWSGTSFPSTLQRVILCVCDGCPATCWLRTNFLVSALAALWIPMWGCVWEQGIEWKSDWMKGSAEQFPPFTSSVYMWLIGAPRVMKGFEYTWFCLHRKCGILCTLPH